MAPLPHLPMFHVKHRKDKMRAISRVLVSFCIGFTLIGFISICHMPLALMVAIVAQSMGLDGYAVLKFLYP